MNADKLVGALDSPGVWLPPKVYVVSLLRATERRKAISEQLARYGIDFEFVDAVDAKEVDPEFLRSQVDEAAIMRNMGRALTGPEIGCALSHRHVYRDIVEEGRSGGIVLEDDAIVQSEFLDAVDYFNKNSQELSSKLVVYHLDSLSLSYSSILVIKKRRAVQATPRLRFVERMGRPLYSKLWSTCGKYITREAAISLLSTPLVETVADDWHFWEETTGGNALLSLPAVIRHPDEPLDSFIEHSRKDADDRKLITTKVHFKNLIYKAKTKVVIFIVKPILEAVY